MTLSRFISVALATVVLLGIVSLASSGLSAQTSSSSIDRTGRVITVVFRMDDYSDAISSNVDAEVVAGFERCRLPVVFGVIPYLPSKGSLSDQPDHDQPLSPAKADRLRIIVDAGLLEIAQHGYSHRSVGAGGFSGNSEFSGLSPDVQRVKIMKGKSLLEGLFARPMVSFCPPFNRYDVNTVRMLSAAGFTTLSAGGFCHADESMPLLYLPGTCNITQTVRAIESARLEQDSQPVIVVLFHPYDFLEEDAGRGFIHLADFHAQLAWVAQQPDIRVLTLSQASREIRDLGAKRYRAFYLCHALARLLPEKLRERIYPPEAYWTIHRSHLWAIKLAAWLATLLGIGFLSALLIVRAVVFRFSFSTRWCGWGLVALPFVAGLWLLSHPGFWGMLLVTVGAGLAAGGLFFNRATQRP